MYECEKYLKVGRVFRDRLTVVHPYVAPVLRMSGHWLRDLGFKSGEQVKVTAKQDLIIIEPLKA